MHWLLDVEFKDDLSRYRQGYGAKNMAVVRSFALDLVRAHRKVKGSVKRRRKLACRDGETSAPIWRDLSMATRQARFSAQF